LPANHGHPIQQDRHLLLHILLLHME